MPKIVVEGPDGRKFAFPDTMPRAEINAFMKQKYGTKAPNESVQDYLARYGREQAATEARVKDIDREATAAGRAEGERAAGRMGVSNPLEMAFAAPAIGLAQQEGGRRVFEREGTVLADEAAGLSAINAAGFFVPGMVNKEFGARVEEGRRQQPLAAFAGDVAGGFGPGEIIGAGVAKAAQAVGPGMAALGRMLSRGPGPDTTNAIVGGTLGGIAPAETAEERARNVAVGAGLGAVARPASRMAADLTTPGAAGAMPDAMPAGGYFGRQSMRPPGSGPSAREIEIRQLWATATPIVTQARTTAQSAQQAADAALQSKAPADIARAKDAKKTLVGQLQEAQASRAGMDTPEDARLAETLASLSENTSDPVLLSTQISAAKTSLDRLLTDIGSPVEGNLIPVRTQILTRTQAPRSAAEGPQDRASVTRYAEGGDDVQPMGFGASTPKTPQQAAPFETPGSPEYQEALLNGDIRPTSEEIYDALRQARKDGNTDVTEIRAIAEAVDRIENGAIVEVITDAFKKFPVAREVADRQAMGYTKVLMSDERAAIAIVQRAIAEARLQNKNPEAVFNEALTAYASRFGDPEDAAFMRQSITDLMNMGNLNKSTSSALQAAAPFAAVGGAGLTSERELGSKMKRDKKD